MVDNVAPFETDRIAGAKSRNDRPDSGLFGNRLRLEVLAPQPSSGRAIAALDPFVTLESRGRFARTVLAAIVGPAGGIAREVALRIQSDDYRVEELEGWTNLDVESQWQRQYRLWSRAGAAAAAPAILDVLPPGDDGGPPRCPPTLYCKERGILFTAPCPACAAPLQTCRDESLLAARGLPGFDTSLQRFLYCPACHAAARTEPLFAAVIADPALRRSGTVGDQFDLYRAFAHLARGGGPLPCFGCASVAACHPEHDPAGGEVASKLTALSFFDFLCLPIEPTRGFYYDEFAAHLGGRRFEDATAHGDDPTYAVRVGAAAERGRDARRYLFEDDPHGKLPLEILRLKLTLFSQLVGAVSRLQSATGLPHLGLSPGSVQVELVEGVPGVPLFWNFRARLVEVGNATLRRLKGLESADLEIPLLDPPPLRDPTYAPPGAARRYQFGRKLNGSLAVETVSEHPDGRCWLEASLGCEEFDLAAVGPKDLLRVEIYQARPVPLATTFFAYGTQAARSLRLRSLPAAIERGTAERLHAVAGGTALDVTFTVFPCAHVPDDVQTLGLMLFTTLTANAEQGPATVTGAARRVAEAVSRFVRETPAAAADDVEEFALQALAEEERQGVFARRQVLDRPSEWAGEVIIPERFWSGALLLGLRALTWTPEFGFCRGHDDFNPVHPEVAAEHLKSELGILAHKVDEELLGMGGKRAMYAEAVGRVRDDLFAARDDTARTRLRS